MSVILHVFGLLIPKLGELSFVYFNMLFLVVAVIWRGW